VLPILFNPAVIVHAEGKRGREADSKLNMLNNDQDAYKGMYNAQFILTHFFKQPNRNKNRE
jgi:hypothetical protein